MIIAVMVGMIPIILIYSVTGSLDCNDVKVEKRVECVSGVEVSKYASYIMGGIMFASAFTGVLWEWKRNQEMILDRSPLKINHLTSQERVIETNYKKEQQEQEAIRKKYEQMEDLK